MNGNKSTERRPLLLAVLLGALSALAVPAIAQVPVDESGNVIGEYQAQSSTGDVTTAAGDYVPLSSAELEELVGPIALYQDDLIAIVLPASTYPLEIVQAARFLEQLESDSSLKPDEEWDESIVALLNYPEVLRMLDEDIDWTWRLGEAVLSQQSELIAAVESFRDRAYAAGNLKSDEYQDVTYEDGVIEIVPVSEEIIHVPYYQPEEVLISQVRPVIHYYPDPYPVYYYPYPAGYRFRSGYFWGVTTAFHIGWSNRYLHVYHPSYWGHPYFGRYYYGHYYRRPSITVYNTWYVHNSNRNNRFRYRDGDYWRPRHRTVTTPSNTRVRVYNDSPHRARGPRDYVVERNEQRLRARETRRTSTDQRERVRVNNAGRMDLNLRERDSTRLLPADRSATGTTSTRRSTADRSSRRTAADTTSRSREVTTRRTTREVTRTSRSTTTPPPANAASRSNRAATSTRTTVTPSSRTSTRSNNANRDALTSRYRDASAAGSRSSAIGTSREATQRSRPTGSIRRPTSAPRTSMPTPRSTAPAVQPRTPPANRSGSRSSDRGRSSSTGSSRQSSSRPRVRSQNKD